MPTPLWSHVYACPRLGDVEMGSSSSLATPPYPAEQSQRLNQGLKRNQCYQTKKTVVGTDPGHVCSASGTWAS